MKKRDINSSLYLGTNLMAYKSNLLSVPHALQGQGVEENHS